MRFRPTFSKGMIFTVLAAFFAACGVVLTRYLLVAGEDPLNLTVWVILFTLLPWVVLFNKHKQEFVRLSRKNIFLLFFVGVAGSIGVSYLQSVALAHTPAVNFAFIYRTVVVFTIFFAWLFFKEKITRVKAILVLCIMIGSYLVTTSGQGLTFTQGDLYSLLLAASAALIANILVKHTISKMHPDLSGSVTVIVGFFALLLLAIITNVFAVPSHLLLIVIGSFLYFALVICRNRAYQFSTASFVTMVFTVSPLFVAILSYFFLHETLSGIEMLGGLIIIASAFLVEKFKI